MIDQTKKTIIFDFGNVLIDLNYDRFYHNLNQILNVDWSLSKIPEQVSNVMKKYEKGQTSDETLIWTFQNINPNVDPRDIIEAWNSLIDRLFSDRLIMLESLKVNYNLAILSNINNLHLKHIHKYFKREYDLIDFESKYFNQVHYSHLIGMRKPESRIYKYVNDALGVDEQSILFIDDLEQNVKNAKEFGWNAIVHNPKNNITDVINGYLNDVGF